MSEGSCVTFQADLVLQRQGGVLLARSSVPTSLSEAHISFSKICLSVKTGILVILLFLNLIQNKLYLIFALAAPPNPCPSDLIPELAANDFPRHICACVCVCVCMCRVKL